MDLPSQPAARTLPATWAAILRRLDSSERRGAIDGDSRTHICGRPAGVDIRFDATGRGFLGVATRHGFRQFNE
jgi:hypothetical protein